jgi:methylated-DNA-[protein]-cysteine S-methyltransferase
MDLFLDFIFYTKGSKISKIEIFDSSCFSLTIQDIQNTPSPELQKKIRQYFKHYSQKKEVLLPLNCHFSAFSEKVFHHLKSIYFAQTITYKELAIKMKSKAYRAVGQALKKNPFPLVLPCHRVVAKKDLGGFAFGKRVKLKLLDFEKNL